MGPLYPFSRSSTSSTNSSVGSFSSRSLGLVPAQVGRLTYGSHSFPPSTSVCGSAIAHLVGEALGATWAPPTLFTSSGPSSSKIFAASGPSSSSSRGPSGSSRTTRSNAGQRAGPSLAIAQEPVTASTSSKKRKVKDRNLSYSCPMVKKNPQFYEEIYGPCTQRQGLGPDAKRIRYVRTRAYFYSSLTNDSEHCETYHSREMRCMRCYKKFKGGDAAANLRGHKDDGRCEDVDSLTVPEIFSPKQEERFRHLAKEGFASGFDLWRRYYQVLHQDRKDHDKSDPFEYLTISPCKYLYPTLCISFMLTAPDYDYVTLTHQIPSYFPSPPPPHAQYGSTDFEFGQLLSERAASDMSPLGSEADMSVPSLVQTSTTSTQTADRMTAATPANSPLAARGERRAIDDVKFPNMALVDPILVYNSQRPMWSPEGEGFEWDERTGADPWGPHGAARQPIYED